MTDINIREFCKNDATAVLLMLSKLAAFHGEHAHVGLQQIISQFEEPKNLASCWIALKQAETIGFLISYDWMNFLRGKKVRHIDLIFVEESFRNQGIGQMLIKYAAQHAVANGCQRIDVGAQQNNIGANHFYKKLGFEGSINSPMKYKIQDQALTNLIKSETYFSILNVTHTTSN